MSPYRCCPCCDNRWRKERYAAERAKWELEDRWHAGTLTQVEKIKLAWAEAKPSWDRGELWRVTFWPPMRTTSIREDPTDRKVKLEDFIFQRTVTHNKGFTVTRISCGDMTLEEIIT